MFQQTDQPPVPEGAETNGDVGVDLLHVVNKRRSVEFPENPGEQSNRKGRRWRDDDVGPGYRGHSGSRADQVEPGPSQETKENAFPLSGHEGVVDRNAVVVASPKNRSPMIPERLPQFRFRIPIEMRCRREDGYLVTLRLQVHTKLAHDLGGRYAVRGKYEGKD